MTRHFLRPDASTVLRSATIVKRRPPINLRHDDAQLFSCDLQREIPSLHLLEMKDVRVSPEGILFKGTRLYDESFAHPWMWDEWRRRTLLKFLAQNYLVRRHVTFENAAAWIVDNWSHSYFHWTDALARLFAIRDRASEMVLLLPHHYKEIEFVTASLRAFNLSGVEFMPPNEVLSCRRMWLPTHAAPSGHFNEDIIRGVRDLMVNLYGERRESNRRVYITRDRAARRRIINESEVIAIVAEHGFEVVHPEDLSFAAQVKMFSTTRYLVSNHGAGLTNMLFMAPGTKVFELRHQMDSINNCYFTLAAALELNYFFQGCEPVNQSDDPHTADLLVDANTLRSTLELMLTDHESA